MSDVAALLDGAQDWAPMALAPTRATLHAGNLPVELTSFVGRRQGLADLKRALASTRLLTLSGAGGVGKTKLAVRAGLVADGASNVLRSPLVCFF